MPDWTHLTKRLESLLRLKTFPVAFKLLEDPADLSKNPWLRRLPHKVTTCQLITIVRTFDWTVGATAEDFVSPRCTSIIGLSELPEYIRDGTMRSMVWCATVEDARKCEDSIPLIPAGKYNAVTLAPLVYNPFDPDIILVYGNPAQMMLLINAIQFRNYERMQFFSVGESACADAIAQCYLTGKPSLTIPCYGERRYGHAMDDEMVMAIPNDYYEKIVDGLEELYKRGIRYPISQFGAQVDPTPGLFAAYGQPPESSE
jgi:uncharacterized protein (DUF169 family)